MKNVRPWISMSSLYPLCVWSSLHTHPFWVQVPTADTHTPLLATQSSPPRGQPVGLSLNCPWWFRAHPHNPHQLPSFHRLPSLPPLPVLPGIIFHINPLNSNPFLSVCFCGNSFSTCCFCSPLPGPLISHLVCGLLVSTPLSPIPYGTLTLRFSLGSLATGGVLVTFNYQLFQKRKKPWFVALTDLCGVKAPIMASFKLPKGHCQMWSWDERCKTGSWKQSWAAPTTPLLATPTQKGGFFKVWKGILEPDCRGPWEPDYGVKNLIYNQRKIIRALELGQTRGHMSLSALCFENINPAHCISGGEKMKAKRQSKLLHYNKGTSTYWGCGNRKWDACKRCGDYNPPIRTIDRISREGRWRS